MKLIYYIIIIILGIINRSKNCMNIMKYKSYFIATNKIKKLVNQNTKSAMKVELNQYVIQGFLDSINYYINFDNIPIMNELYKNKKKNITNIVSEYKIYEKINNNTVINTYYLEENSKYIKIKKMIIDLIPKYYQIYFYNFDLNTILPIRHIYKSYKFYLFNDKNYMQKTNIPAKFIRYKIRRIFF